MTYLFDTDHISIHEMSSGRERVALAARMARQDPADLAYSIVSFHEQLLCVHAYIGRARTPLEVTRGYRLLETLLRSYSAFKVLPFDAPAAAIFDGLRAQRIRVATMDLRIASIALSRGLVLLTRNARDFANIPGLATEDWTA